MIITRYITQEILRPFVLICAVLLLLMVSYSALVLLADAESHLLSVKLLVVLIFSKTIAAFELFLPLALYITLLIGLGKLYSKSEISALQASGMSVFALMRCLMPLILLITIATAIVSIFVRPWAYDLRYAAKYQAKQTLDFERLEEGYFYENKDSGQVFFVKNINQDDQVKNDIFIYQPGQQIDRIIYAKKGYTREASDKLSPVMVFEQGSAFLLSETVSDTLVNFGQFVLQSKDRQIAPPSFKRKAASTIYLAKSGDRYEQAEYQWRVTSAFKALLLAMIAVMLAKTSPRQGKYGKLIIGVLIFFLVHGGSLVLKAWIEQGTMNTMPGLWSVVIALGGGFLILARRYF